MKISRRSFLFGALGTTLSMVLARAGLNAQSVMAATLSHSRRAMKGHESAAPRVVAVHSPGATSWDFSTYPYVDFVDEERVGRMLNTAVKTLAREKSDTEAWRSIFTDYRPGDRIAIKPNLNDIHKGFNGLVTSPAVLNSVIKGLVNFLGAHPGDIAVYELCRAIPYEMRGKIKYPVNFVEGKGETFITKLRYKALGAPLAEADLNAEIKMSNEILDGQGRPVKCYMPQVITSSRHIINIPLLKSHQFVALSGALKNHYGTVRFGDGSRSPQYLHPPLIDESIVDLNANEEIRTKTRLVVMDALFGRTRQHGGGPEKWSTLGGGSPDRLFVSRDPVAVDSLGRDLLAEEMKNKGETILSDKYLRNAHERGLGIYERPAGKGKFKNLRVGEIEV